MEALFRWINKHIKAVILLGIFIILGVPLIIHILFKITPTCDYFSAVWSAGDFLQYYASIISGICTVVLAYVAIKQTHDSNVMSNNMLKAEELSNKTYVKLNLENTVIELYEGFFVLWFCFKNISNIPIFKMDIKESDLNLYCDDVETSPYTKIVKEIDTIREFDENGSVGEITRRLHIEREDEILLYIVNFVIEMENILGYKSKQAFSIALVVNENEQYQIENYRAKAILD